MEGTLLKVSSPNLIEALSKIITQERNALDLLIKYLDESWCKALTLLLNCPGRVIVSGIGKSGLIARKIAATLASTGTSSFFLHPAEALHGDLGMVSGRDVMLVLSKSGESDEVNGMLAVVRRIGSPIIALTSNAESTMARLADVVLNQGESAEACPFNLAPTCSTTASLVAGDALAVVLMQLRGFSQDDFALRHPGGRLGKRLLLMVADVMLSGSNNPTISINSSMRDLLVVLTEKQAGAVSVVDQTGRLAGLITDYDIRKVLQQGRNPLELSLFEIMNPAPSYVSCTEKAYTALCLMQGRSKPITVLPVLDGERRPIGMLRLQDLVGAGL